MTFKDLIFSKFSKKSSFLAFSRISILVFFELLLGPKLTLLRHRIVHEMNFNHQHTQNTHNNPISLTLVLLKSRKNQP